MITDDNAPVRSLLRSPLLRVIMSRGTKDALARFSTRRDLLNHRCLVIVFIEAAREVARFPVLMPRAALPSLRSR